MCSSPWLFAACHVLLRRLVPRHPPCAFFRLISLRSSFKTNQVTFLLSFEIVGSHIFFVYFVSLISKQVCIPLLFSLFSSLILHHVMQLSGSMVWRVILQNRTVSVPNFTVDPFLCLSFRSERIPVGMLSHPPDVLPRKEVIQPHLPIRLPCYDFTPVIGFAFDAWLLAVTSAASGAPNSHGVTGGVYKARERIHRDILIRDY